MISLVRHDGADVSEDPTVCIINIKHVSHLPDRMTSHSR
jgi:hypothetical protein